MQGTFGLFIPCDAFGNFVGAWLADADVDARDGWGSISFTLNQDDAKQFSTVGEALDFWRQQSHTRPLRPDGVANRPITGFCAQPLPLSAKLELVPVELKEGTVIH